SFLSAHRPQLYALLPYTTLFRSARRGVLEVGVDRRLEGRRDLEPLLDQEQAVADGRLALERVLPLGLGCPLEDQERAEQCNRDRGDRAAEHGASSLPLPERGVLERGREPEADAGREQGGGE